ncbi:hypothetical protein CHH92_23005 [Bacillus sonorensis]|uniref:Uncharacterized protein n=1 Tax=Bacillus sonorensis L12 TaxID=1274524 RepID=M5NZI6_9BACI|nr:hypothetical protein [Bacillus sonorensis]EME72583.1 hypothetical protein BSONL12_21794 [Bacillus sonorensis L12]MBG9915180.1 hypothetical protein [Bacillus sonorensis]PAD57893.1 hypothetical protein CHH92_23005 [Bacillus sonorensis]RHJ04822.1 hypothetical protein DW143_22695 [Bacillus sonorensis]GIN67482.1 hypothetical protein J41TS2_29030 [Bacillus sonorensis]
MMMVVQWFVFIFVIETVSLFDIRWPAPGQSITPVELHSKNILLVLSEREMTVEKKFFLYIKRHIHSEKKVKALRRTHLVYPVGHHGFERRDNMFSKGEYE